MYARRPLCNKDYYETYNRDNVSLVSIKENPIVEITPEGVKTADGVVHELDVLVFATGFDSVDGNYLRMDIRGKGGETIQKHWEKGATSYLGIATAGFPGLFMILGPGGPFTNLPPSIEVQVEWISQLVADANAAGAETVEVRAETEKAWADTCDMIAGYTLFPKVDSWIFGANIPGKTTSVVFYLAGLGAYREQLAAESAGGYQGFTLQGVKTAASV